MVKWIVLIIGLLFYFMLFNNQVRTKLLMIYNTLFLAYLTLMVLGFFYATSSNTAAINILVNNQENVSPTCVRYHALKLCFGLVHLLIFYSSSFNFWGYQYHRPRDKELDRYNLTKLHYFLNLSSCLPTSFKINFIYIYSR